MILTSGSILLGAESRAYIGMSLILSGYYGMLFAHMKPIEDPSENSLMLSSLAVTYVNLVIGAVSRIPEEVALDTLYPNLERVLFDILVVGVNVLVILVLLGKHIIYYLLLTLHLLLLSFSVIPALTSRLQSRDNQD